MQAASGYQLQYTTYSKFSKATTKWANKNSTVSSKFTKLKKGKTYYVRIRTYKTVNKTKVYSNWCTAKKVVIKK